MVDTRSTEEILKAYPRWKYDRTDRNGTRYFVDYTCPRCGGRGVLDCYRYVEGGICFECGGSGVSDKPEIIKVYTPEHEAKLAAQREARAAKREQERINEATKNYEANMEKNGFGKENDEFVIYRVIGDTYSIKDELKALGCKFKPAVGWYSNHALEGYKTQRMTSKEVLEEGIFIVWKDKADVEKLWVENQHDEADPSEWQGTVGERIERELFINKKVDGVGYMGKTSYFYIMTDKNDNVYTWSSSCWYDEGDYVHFKATVKAHEEYKGRHQTRLTRCTQVKEQI